MRDPHLAGELRPERDDPVHAPVAHTDEPQGKCEAGEAQQDHDNVRHPDRQERERRHEVSGDGRPDEVRTTDRSVGRGEGVLAAEEELRFRIELVVKVTREWTALHSHHEHPRQNCDRDDSEANHFADAPQRGADIGARGRSLQFEGRLGCHGHDERRSMRDFERAPWSLWSRRDGVPALDVCPAIVGRRGGAWRTGNRHAREADELKIGRKMTDVNSVSSIRLTPRAATLAQGAATRSWTRAFESPAIALAVVVTVSTVIRAVLSLGVPAPSVVPDEVVYSDLAKSIAAGGFPSVRGVHELGWGVVYQMLIAPAWLLFDDPVRAYHGALVINSLLMSLAAVPAYFLSRMFVSARSSIVVAAATVVVPSMSYTGFVLTENACYPAFLLALLVVARALRSPSVVNQAVALLGLGVVSLTRIQGAALVGAYLAAVVVHSATRRAGRSLAVSATVRPDGGRRPHGVVHTFPSVRRARRWGRRLARRPLGHVRRASSRRGTAVVRLPHRWAHALRGRGTDCGNGDPGRSGPSTNCGPASAAFRCAGSPDPDCHADLRGIRQRVARRRQYREPQRALPVLRRAAALRRPRAVD